MTNTMRKLSPAMITTLRMIAERGGIVGFYALNTTTAVALINRGLLTPTRRINHAAVCWLTEQGFRQAFLYVEPSTPNTMYAVIEQAEIDAYAEDAARAFCPDPECTWNALPTGRVFQNGVLDAERLLNRHVAMTHLPVGQVSGGYWGKADESDYDHIRATHHNVLTWRAGFERHRVELIGPDASGTWGFKCLTGGCDTLWNGYAADEIEAVAEAHGAISADSERPEVEPVTLVSETPSVFADAPPVRTYSDGSQTYGPYGPIDKAAILAKPIDSLMNSGAVEPDDSKDVHTEHCCKRHGCKYGAFMGNVACTVTSGEKEQSYPCEEYEDDPDPAPIADAEHAAMLAGLKRLHEISRTSSPSGDALYVIGWLSGKLLGAGNTPVEPENDAHARRLVAECAGALRGLIEFAHEEYGK